MTSHKPPLSTKNTQQISSEFVYHFIFIALLFFLNTELLNQGCGLSTSAAYTQVYTVSLIYVNLLKFYYSDLKSRWCNGTFEQLGHSRFISSFQGPSGITRLLSCGMEGSRINLAIKCYTASSLK